jgi:hypothetical protein
MNKLQLQVFTMGMAKRGWNGKPGYKMISGLKNRGGGRGGGGGMPDQILYLILHKEVE